MERQRARLTDSCGAKGQKLDSHPARCCGSFSVRIAGVAGSILVCIPIPEILQIR